MIKGLLVQNNAIIGNRQATFNNVEKLLEPYRGKTFDFITFPEVWSCGWSCKNFKLAAENLENSETVNFLKNVALDFKTTVFGGSFIRKVSESDYRNTCPVVDKNGRISACYDKMHLFSHKGSEENRYITPGDYLVVINTGNVKIGLSICYDIRYPEIYRAYSKQGVQIFINSAAWNRTKLEHWLIMHRARAIENQCYMIVADQCGKIAENEYNLGHSLVADGWGDVLYSLGEQEGCLEFALDIEKLNKLRQDFPLLKDRRDKDFSSFKIKEIKLYE